jgi:predicted nucleotidyltransferase
VRRLEDITTLTEDEKQMLREVKAAVLRHQPNAEVILYGSAARGERGPESDYDVLVLVGRPLSVGEEDEIDAAVYEVELARGAVLSLMFYGVDEWGSALVSATPYRRSVEREGVAL